MRFGFRTLGLVTGVALSAGLAAGCRTYIPITRFVPGPVSIGAGKHLVVMETKGRRSAREELIDTLKDQARSHGYFTVADESESGADVRVAGRKVSVDGGPALAPDHVGVLIQVHEWSARRDSEEYQEEYLVTEGTGENAREVTRYRTRTRKVTVGEVVLGVTLWRPNGATITAEREYIGRFMGDGQMPREDAQINAGRDAINQLLADITPHKVTEYVLVDKSDDAQSPIIGTAAAGNLAQAAEDMERYATQNPNNAAAAYNMGVFSEGMGDYTIALQWYDRAITLGAQDFYHAARRACATRKSAQDDLSGN